MGTKIDYDAEIGKRYGRLVITEILPPEYKQHRKVKVICDCGNTKIVTLHDIYAGDTRSCGCLKKDLQTKGHRSSERLYRIWYGMKQRCYNPNNDRYYRYGGRGIQISPEWHDYDSFRKWAYENGYQDSLTIERIDIDGDYEPSNCCWISKEEQMNNTSVNIHVTYNGETHNLRQWGMILGINPNKLYARYKNGRIGDELFYKGNLPRKRKVRP